MNSILVKTLTMKNDKVNKQVVAWETLEPQSFDRSKMQSPEQN